jgi:hypothetical protein
VPAELAHGGGKPVDGRHDGARLRHLALKTRLHEVVLHVDHHERGFRRLDHIERMRSPGARGDAVHEIGGDRQFVHGGSPAGFAALQQFLCRPCKALLAHGWPFRPQRH